MLKGCSIYVLDKTKRKYRRCKNYAHLWTRCCYTHVKYDAIYIQCLWRGYRARKKLGIFTKLPDVLWDRILYFSRKLDLFQKNTYNTILNIYYKKTIELQKRFLAINNYEIFEKKMHHYRMVTNMIEKIIHKKGFKKSII